jgi:hypothetical protein
MPWRETGKAFTKVFHDPVGGAEPSDGPVRLRVAIEIGALRFVSPSDLPSWARK